MNDQEILSKLTMIFRDVLDQDKLVLTPETTASDVDDWDSLAHISIMGAITGEFKMKFTLDEVLALKNVGDMVNLIIKKSHA